MPSLVDKVLAIAAALESSETPYAFGGALALAYATADPRGTRDIDVNVFLSAQEAPRAFEVFPAGVDRDPQDIETARRDEQVRLWWDDMPVDIFFAAHPFHLAAGRRARRVDFVGTMISVLAPSDLAVFRVLFDRSKDWVDIETMIDSGTLDVDEVIDTVTDLLGDDQRVTRLRALSGSATAERGASVRVRHRCDVRL